MKRLVRSQEDNYRKVTAKLLVEVEAEFDDPESSEETIRYLVEQDLEESSEAHPSWTVLSCELAE